MLPGKPVLSLLNIAMMTIPLAACNQASSRLTCPPLATYSAAFQQKAASEFRQAGGNVRVMVTDYGKLRDACRTIEGKT